MNKQNILRSTAALTLSGIIAKTIDFIFRAYYSRRLGGEGIGIFSLVFSVHGIMLNIATGGLGVAVSKIVSEQYIARRLGDIKKTMQIALSAVFVLSTTVIILTCCFSGQIARYFLKEPRCRMSIVCLSPSILFMGLSYCIKGYFYASRKILFPASSEFLEQTVKITVIKFLLDKMLPLGIEHGCEAVFSGLSIGEFSSCLYLSAMYCIDRRRLTGKPNAKGIFQSVLKVSIPVMATSIAGSFLRMWEEVLIVSSLKNSGLNQASALSQYGGIHGMVMPLIVFPLTLLSSCFTMLIPEISRAHSMTNPVRLKTLVCRIYRFAAFLGFLIAAVIMAFAESLSELVYHAPEISSFLRKLCFLAPFMFMDSVSCGILNGMGKQSSLFFYSISDSFLRIALISVLIPRFGINALIAVIVASNLFTFKHTVKKVLSEAYLHFEISGWLFKHFAASAIACFVARSFFSVLTASASAIAVLISIVFTAAVYFAAEAALNSASRSDFVWMIRRMFFNT